MLTAYIVANQTLQKKQVSQCSELTQDIRWLDLNNPTEQERHWVKQAYRQDLQFMEELGEIEASARFFRDEQGLHMHLYFLQSLDGTSRNVNVAFTVNQGRLYTLHADDLPEFGSYYTYATSHPELHDDALSILLGMILVSVGSLADTYEKLQVELESLSHAIFRGDADRKSTRLNSSHIQKSRMPSSA